jgi:hypothetical protein
MRSLFQAIEQFLGPSLDTVATVLYWSGIVLLVHSIVSPVFRLRMEMISARLKMQESVVMECPYCHRETVVHDSQCAFCRKSLELPFSVRAWHFIRCGASRCGGVGHTGHGTSWDWLRSLH